MCFSTFLTLLYNIPFQQFFIARYPNDWKKPVLFQNLTFQWFFKITRFLLLPAIQTNNSTAFLPIYFQNCRNRPPPQHGF